MIQLIGGEMTVWSDLDGTHGPAPAGDPTLRPLLAGATGRVLVAGPHAPELLDAIPSDQVTLLVRGIPDAEALASRPGVTVCCGSLEKLTGLPAYDTVIALDGLDRLRSAEADDASWDETLTQLLALLSPQGRLLLRLENLFGLDRLVALPPAPADTEWVTPDDETRPTGPDAMRARLAAAGVPVVRDYAAYPGALLGGAVLADPALRGFLEATLVAAAEPAHLITGALRHNLADDLAPAWIFLAGPGATGPEALIAAGEVRRDAGGRWVRGDDRPVPLGRTLEGLLLAACGRRAQPELRELLTAWQRSPAAGVPAAQVLVDADGRFHPLAPAGAAVEALRRLAATMVDGGYAYLWPSPADEASLTALLAGMTGRELDPRDVPTVSRSGRETVRELTIARDRLAGELAEARAQHEFYERQIASRDHELKRVRQLNAVLSATAPGKAAHTLVRGVRAVVRRTRG
ncbi:hypothetical protein [Paractinoplanes durhamensis]|uniref:Uncharacterized protein n=1 Tax=Paractinoplanes durhamensis TaxID=113563 RepID=A0ABQ3YW87_9ACTN|nr:hypothetical protein [Actinoplanes durhamensis]GIE01860.1 hypothetical protein Adu01nite_32100 [Actinoplanes durhamensis]